MSREDVELVHRLYEEGGPIALPSVWLGAFLLPAAPHLVHIPFFAMVCARQGAS